MPPLSTTSGRERVHRYSQPFFAGTVMSPMVMLC